MARVPTFSPWENLATQPDNTGIEGDQINPAVMDQLAQQAAPETPAPQQQMPMDLATQYIMSLGAPLSPQEQARIDQASQYAQQNMQRQSLDVNSLRDALAKYQQEPQQTDYRPLATLVDTMFGGGGAFGKVAQEIAPESQAEKAARASEMLNRIAQAQSGLTRDQLDYLKQQQSYLENRKSKEAIAKAAALAKMAGTGMQQQRLDLQNKRLGFQTDKEARAAANNDPMLKLYTPRLEGAAKIGELIQSAREGKVVRNNALLGQLNAEIARLETGSQSPGLGQSEKTELLSAAAQIGAVRDRITGNPQDAVPAGVINAADKLVKELSSSYAKGIDSRFQFLKGGSAPQQRHIFEEKHKAIKDTYAPRLGGWHGLQGDNLENMSDEELLKLYNGGK